MSQSGALSVDTSVVPIETLTGNSGGAVGPNGSGNIDILGNNTSGINVVGTPASNLLTIIGIQASTTQQGTVELATAVETGNLTSASLAVTPASLGPILITPYVVAPGGAYTTIQSAINAANAAGGGTVYIRPGTYNENITLYAEVNLQGYSGDSGNIAIFAGSLGQPSVEITGSLTIDTSALPANTNNFISNIFFNPPTGDILNIQSNPVEYDSFNFYGCVFTVNENGKNIISSGGYTTINFENCTLNEGVGITGNLIAYVGALFFVNINARSTSILVNSVTPCVIPSLVDTHIALTDCLYYAMLDVSSGMGTAVTIDAMGCSFFWDGAANEPLLNLGSNGGYLNISNSLFIGGSGAFATASVVGADTYFQINNTFFYDTLFLQGQARDTLNNCVFFTLTSPCIQMSGSEDISVNNCIMNTSNNPAITGAGAGTLTLTNVSFVDNAALAGTLTLGTSSVYPVSMTNGQLLIGSTGQPAVAATLTAGTGIAIANAAGSITVSTTTGGFTWSVIGASQGLAVENGYFCTSGAALSLALPAVSAVGDTIQVVLDGSTSWTITQPNAGTQIRIGNTQTTLGVGGSIASTAQGDSIELVCETANARWVAVDWVGNLTVV